MDILWEQQLDSNSNSWQFDFRILAIDESYVLVVSYDTDTDLAPTNDSKPLIIFQARFFLFAQDSGRPLMQFNASTELQVDVQMNDTSIDYTLRGWFFPGRIVAGNVYLPLWLGIRQLKLDRSGIIDNIIFQQVQIWDIDLTTLRLETIDIPETSFTSPSSVATSGKSQMTLTSTDNGLALGVVVVQKTTVTDPSNAYLRTYIWQGYRIDPLTGTVELVVERVFDNCIKGIGDCRSILTNDGYAVVESETFDKRVTNDIYVSDVKIRQYDWEGNNRSSFSIRINSTIDYTGPLYAEKEFMLMGMHSIDVQEIKRYPYLLWRKSDNSLQRFIPLYNGSVRDDGEVLGIYPINGNTYGIVTLYYFDTIVLHIFTLSWLRINSLVDLVLAVGLPSLVVLLPTLILYFKLPRFSKTSAVETYPEYESKR